MPFDKCDRIAGAQKLMLKHGNKGGVKVQIVTGDNLSASRKIQKSESAKKRPDGFYKSWEWKRVRFEAIKLHGQRCQCCGWQPGDTDRGHLVVDHIRPRSKFPELSLELSNLQILCNDCNMGKSNVYQDDFRGFDDWLASIGAEI